MGKLQTAVTLPKRILLQGWANDEGGLNINGEYTYTINFDIAIIIGGGPSAFYNGYKHNTLNAFIYFAGAWQFLTFADPNQWDNPSTNNVLPLTGWIEGNAQGPAGTITILENISGKNTKISIKKQNLGGGRLLLNYIFDPKEIQGLSLWLKADAGTTTEPEQFISQIILSGAGTTTSNGTYTRASGSFTEFTGPNGNTITFDEVNANGLFFFLYDANLGTSSYGITINYTSIISISFSAGAFPVPTASTTLSPTGNTIVTAWADQSGNGKNATTLNNSPTITTINSKTFVRFNGVDQALSGSNVISAIPCTIISVVRWRSFKGIDMWFQQNGGEDNVALYAGDSFGWRVFNGENLNSTDATWGFDVTQLATTIVDGVNSSHFHNGTAAGTGNSGDTTPAGNYYLSYWAAAEENPYRHFDIAEIIIYNRILTTPERQQVETYLKGKYAITCGYQNINKLVQTAGSDAPIGATFDNIAFDYASFAGYCSALGLDPATILNNLGGVDFSSNYVVIRAKTSSTINSDSISDLGSGVINITNVGPSSGTVANRYRFFVMCKDGWNTVNFYGVNYPI
jgi:hypothetical protein